jgi:hypothetical protein
MCGHREIKGCRMEEKVRVREFGILKTGQTEGQKIVCLFLFVVVDRFEGLSPLVVAHVSSACVVCWVC